MMDRRRLTRYDIEDYFAVVDRDSNKIVGRLANLSIEGVMLITERPIKKRAILRVSLELVQPVLGHSQIDFDAECRWCRKGKGVDWFESGYKLNNVSIKDQTTIMCLILQLLSDKAITHEAV
jgi:hypothetical protein